MLSGTANTRLQKNTGELHGFPLSTIFNLGDEQGLVA
jgi:hypothetical protein